MNAQNFSDIDGYNDVGSETLHRYDYQDKLAIPLCAEMAVGRSGIAAIYPEYIEDLAVEDARGWRFIQVKSHGASAGLWNLTKVITSGALSSLWRTHETVRASARKQGLDYELGVWLSGPIDTKRHRGQRDLLQVLVAHCEDGRLVGHERWLKRIQKLFDNCSRADAEAKITELVNSVGSRVTLKDGSDKRNLTKDEARLLIEMTWVEEKPPLDGADSAARLWLHELAPHLSKKELDAIFEQVLIRIKQAASGARGRTQRAKYLPQTLDESVLRKAPRLKFEAKRLTRDVIQELLAPLTKPPPVALRQKLYRSDYLNWFAEKHESPGWLNAYTPKFLLDNSTNTTPICGEEIGLALVQQTGPRSWVLVGDRSVGRTALLKHIAHAFANMACSSERRLEFDTAILPVWCPAHHATADSPLSWSRNELENGIEANDTNLIIDELVRAAKMGRAIFVVDDLEDPALFTHLRNKIGDCPLLIGAPDNVAAKINNAELIRIAALEDEDRLALVRHWLLPERRSVKNEESAGPLAQAPLEILAWCEAENIAGDWTEIAENRSETRIARLEKLFDDLWNGQPLTPDSSLSSRGIGINDRGRMQGKIDRLAYQAIIDDKMVVESDSIDMQLVARESKLLTLGQERAFRFVHPALHIYAAARHMTKIGDPSVASHAQQMSVCDHPQQDAWCRALALSLDEFPEKAYERIGPLIRHERNQSVKWHLGCLERGVFRALAFAETLNGSELIGALDDRKIDPDWTGYRPDAWRTIQERLRYLYELPDRVPDMECLIQLLRHIIRGAAVIDLALIRFLLSRWKEQTCRKRVGEHTNEETLDWCDTLEKTIFERETFFRLAKRPCRPDSDFNIEWKPVPEGWFWMGSPESEEGSWRAEHPQHPVKLSEFQMSKTEITNDDYEKFDKSHTDYRIDGRLEHVPKSENLNLHPVIRVSWWEAWCFAEWLGSMLPTEAQWEKAARGDCWPGEGPPETSTANEVSTPYFFSRRTSDLKLNEVACHKSLRNPAKHTTSVDKHRPAELKHHHPFGLLDVCGNVWEWCMDERGFGYEKEPRRNPRAYEILEEEDSEGKRWPKEGIHNREIRGGSWDSPPLHCRHGLRHHAYPSVRAINIGFRLCRPGNHQ